MGRYFVRRLLETIPLMLIISIFVFMFIHLLPGDPAKTLAGVEATVEEVEASANAPEETEEIVVEDVAASFQEAVVEVLSNKAIKAAKEKGYNTVEYCKYNSKHLP